MNYLAIDPGTEWAAALITEAPGRVLTFTPLNRGDLFEILYKHRGKILTAIEMIRPLWGAAAASNFTFAKKVGYWEGIFDYIGVTYIEINTAKWQAWAMNKPERPDIKGKTQSQVRKIKAMHNDAIKLESIRAAKAAFPDCKIDSHHVADAINMARYLRFLHKGEKNEKGKERKTRNEKGRI